MARVRLILVAALAALCACAGAAVSSAIGTHPRAHRAHARSTHAPRTASCARARRSHRSRHHSRSASFRNSHRVGRLGHCGRRHGPRRPLHHTLGSSAADAGGACAGAELMPSSSNIDVVRAATACLINHERALHGESPLRTNSRIEQAAQGHTESMAFGDYFEHVGPRGDTPQGRMRASGYVYSSQIGYQIAENIGWGTGTLGTPRAIVAAWMGSAGHRANILDPQFRDTAIGVSPHVPASLAEGQAGGIYTQDFGVIIGG